MRSSTDVDSIDVCEAVTPGQCASCTTWQCIYDRLAKPGGQEKNTIAQMTGVFLTGQAEGEFGDFVINTVLYEPNAPAQIQLHPLIRHMCISCMQRNT